MSATEPINPSIRPFDALVGTKLNDVPADSMLRMADTMDRIAADTRIPNKWLHPFRHHFYIGRTCCLREQAANIRDRVAYLHFLSSNNHSPSD
jgi:hypothetical protein